MGDLDIPSLAIAGMERDADLEVVVHNNSTIMALADDTATMGKVELDNTMATIQAALVDTEGDCIEHLAFDIATAM